VEKYDNRYSDDPANLACHGLGDLLAGFTRILAGCTALLRPGGTVVVTARPWRQRGELVDLPGAVLIPRPSVFQLDNIRNARARGEPWHLIVHEDVLIFRAPGFPGGSRELKGSPGELKGQARRFSHGDRRVAGELGAAA
jgi:modification methylase